MLLRWVLLASLLGVPVLSHAQPACSPQSTVKTSVILAWTAPVPPSSITLTSYWLQQKIDMGSWVDLAAVAGTATSVTFEDLEPGLTYAWRLRAIGKTTTGTHVQSGYATYGSPPPCLTVQAPTLNVPTNFTAIPQ